MLRRLSSVVSRRSAASRATIIRFSSTLTGVDSRGIPLKPTWSVNELLSSYPRPEISPATLERLHKLSALVPPEEGSKEHKALTHEIEELIRLVEAVKLVDTGAVAAADGEAVPDGRIWPAGMGIDLSERQSERRPDVDGESGRALLAHAAKTVDGLYVVEADKRRRK